MERRPVCFRLLWRRCKDVGFERGAVCVGGSRTSVRERARPCKAGDLIRFPPRRMADGFRRCQCRSGRRLGLGPAGAAGHGSVVSCVQFAPRTGAALMSSSMDGTVRFWGSNDTCTSRAPLGRERRCRWARLAGDEGALEGQGRCPRGIHWVWPRDEGVGA